MSRTSSPPVGSVPKALLGALNVALVGLSFLFGFPAWASIAAITASIVWVLLNRQGWSGPRAGAAAVAVALVFAFATEGVVSTFADGTTTHRYFVAEDRVTVHIAPDDDSPITRPDVLFPGDEIQILCLGGPREAWAKLDNGAWIEAEELIAEVDADSAPGC